MMKRSRSDSPDDVNIQDNDDAPAVAGGATAINSTSLACNKRTKVDSCDWEALFQRLGIYKKQHGHCSVPLQNEDDPELGNWGKFERKSSCVLGSLSVSLLSLYRS